MVKKDGKKSSKNKKGRKGANVRAPNRADVGQLGMLGPWAFEQGLIYTDNRLTEKRWVASLLRKLPSPTTGGRNGIPLIGIERHYLTEIIVSDQNDTVAVIGRIIQNQEALPAPQKPDPFPIAIFTKLMEFKAANVVGHIPKQEGG